MAWVRFVLANTVAAPLHPADRPHQIDRVIFCTFLPDDRDIYVRLMRQLFAGTAAAPMEKAPGTDEDGHSDDSNNDME